MSKMIVEHRAFAFDPRPGLAANLQRAVSRRNLNSQMAANTHVCGSLMRCNVCSRGHSRNVDQSCQTSDSVVRLDDIRNKGTTRAVFDVFLADFVEERYVP